MRSAAAITSITMNGGTLLRSDAVSRFFARSLSVASSIVICYLPSGCPRLAAFGGLVGHSSYPARRQSQRPLEKTLNAASHRATQKHLEADGADHSGRTCRCANTCACANEQG